MKHSPFPLFHHYCAYRLDHCLAYRLAHCLAHRLSIARYCLMINSNMVQLHCLMYHHTKHHTRSCYYPTFSYYCSIKDVCIL
jgi:hypothetical protein